MAAPSQHPRLSEQQSKGWLDDIWDAAAGLEEAFVCGGSETCAQPVRIVYTGRGAQNMVKSLSH